MGSDVVVSTHFKVFLAVGLVVSLGVKALVVGSVSNPSDREIVEAAMPFFERQGFQVMGPTSFAGRDALLAQRDDCLMYVIPVAHQGWHQATVRQSLDPTQKLAFVFEGRIAPAQQERWRPLLTYYLFKAARYTGVDLPYPPVFGLAMSGNCQVETLDWASMPRIAFHRLLIGGFL